METATREEQTMAHEYIPTNAELTAAEHETWATIDSQPASDEYQAAVERNAYRDRFPDVPDEWPWPTREEDDALIASAQQGQ